MLHCFDALFVTILNVLTISLQLYHGEWSESDFFNGIYFDWYHWGTTGIVPVSILEVQNMDSINVLQDTLVYNTHEHACMHECIHTQTHLQTHAHIW